MAETVYILGAGANRTIEDRQGLRPPLANDFFSQALRDRRLGTEEYAALVMPVFEYIERHWHVSRKDLRSCAFDLEECFTLLQLQGDDAARAGNDAQRKALLNTAAQLTRMLVEFLSLFEGHSHSSEAFGELGKVIYTEQSPAITFNYDTLLEQSLQSASGLQKPRPASLERPPYERGPATPELMAYSHCNWSLPLGYGVRFDEVQLQYPGAPPIVAGSDFYAASGNGLYPAPVLKLHGSLNWFTRTGLPRYPGFELPPAAQINQTLLYNGTYWLNEPATIEGEILLPLIITPALYKSFDRFALVSELWHRASDELRACQRLIIIGYSFPPTDFYTKRLLMEAFSAHPPRELVIVNPDTSVIQIAKRLCNFRKPVSACRDLDEFIGGRPRSG